MEKDEFLTGDFNIGAELEAEGGLGAGLLGINFAFDGPESAFKFGDKTLLDSGVAPLEP